MEGYCGKCNGVWAIVIGVLVIVKEYLFVNLGWPLFLGLLLIFVGIMLQNRPQCGCGGGCCAPPIEKMEKMKVKKR